MDQFLRYFHKDFKVVFEALKNAIFATIDFLLYLVDFPRRIELLKAFDEDFKTADWVLLIITYIVLGAIVILLFIFFVKLLRKLVRFLFIGKKHEALVKQVKNLQRDLIRANYEKDKLLAMKVAELGLSPEQVDMNDVVGALYQETEADEADEEAAAAFENPNRNTFASPCVNPSDSRFFRLTSVDNYYKTEYQKPTYETDITLEEFCERFRKYSASQLHLYYDISMMRYFIAALGAARIVILQGISGTGKTSLPYAFGKFVQKDTTVVSVQPSWRERTELYGYFNEFTKKYTETDFLRSIYEANYFRDPHIVILDEMNIARVEYYFAEMLSILEMPREEEWKIDIVTATWDNDPCLIEEGKVQITNNVWFVGTINNDDSTFAVADKVYDRAIPIDLDSRADAFDCDLTDPIYVSTDTLNALFAKAKQDHPISEEVLNKLEEMNRYLIKNFQLAFGNRIMKQLRDYVPCFIACGGTEMEAVDFIVAKKVLRKFESLSLGFMKEELSQLIVYMDKLFGKDVMKICKQYVEHLKKMS